MLCVTRVLVRVHGDQLQAATEYVATFSPRVSSGGPRVAREAL